MTLIPRELQPVFSQIANALVEATPEWWKSATLELVAPPTGFGSGLAHTISSTEYPKDLVVATDELFAATRQLELICQKHGDSWRRCIFRIRQQGESWHFEADFERDT